MPFRFVHTADIHLDSPLRSLALRDPELAELIGNATRRALEKIVDLCLAEQVDALLLAGDLYDNDQTSMKTARFLATQIRKLHEAGIRVFIIRGNHDAVSRITNELTFPDTVKIFGGRAEAIQLDRHAGHTDIAIHGISFAKPQAPESLLPKFRPPVAGAINIALLHTSLGGAPGHDEYAPCSPADLHAAGFDYWALGHIHKRAVERGRAAVVMPGMPQGRDINESGAKSVSLVTIADDRSIHIEERTTSVAQFERIAIDLTGIEHWSDMIKRLEPALAAARAQVPSDHLVVRLQLAGTTPLAWRLRNDAALLHTEAADLGFALQKLWIEKVEVACRASGPPAGAAPDPLAELRTLIERDIADSEAFRAEIAAIAEELRNQLPNECRATLGANEAEFAGIVAALAEQGAEDVLAALRASTGGEPA
jgi:DNA repair exonuclease SbcCD nuclease subunit